MLLDKNCLKLLNYMDKHDEIDHETAIKLVSDKNAGRSIAHLKDIEFIAGDVIDADVCDGKLCVSYDYPYHLTVKGQGYLESVHLQNRQMRIDNLNKWYGTIVATIALIIAVLAYIKQ